MDSITCASKVGSPTLEKKPLLSEQLTEQGFVLLNMLLYDELKSVYSRKKSSDLNSDDFTYLKLPHLYSEDEYKTYENLYPHLQTIFDQSVQYFEAALEKTLPDQYQGIKDLSDAKGMGHLNIQYTDEETKKLTLDYHKYTYEAIKQLSPSIIYDTIMASYSKVTQG